MGATAPQREVVGIEVWTGEPSRKLPDGQWAHPTAYFTIDMDGITGIGFDGYPGGSYWIRYENGETHAYTENAVRRVVIKEAQL